MHKTADGAVVAKPDLSGMGCDNRKWLDNRTAAKSDGSGQLDPRRQTHERAMSPVVAQGNHTTWNQISLDDSGF